jgi:hypothetical protein
MEEDLTSAEFEPVTVDGVNNFIFSGAIQKLRRSIKGLHNKIFPIYVSGTMKRRIHVLSSNPTAINPITMGSVPSGKRWVVTGFNLSFVTIGVGGAYSALTLYTVHNAVAIRMFGGVPFYSGIGNGTPGFAFRDYGYENGIVLLEGDTIINEISGATGQGYVSVNYVEEDDVPPYPFP